ncbi:GntR family transcriptional regulator [Sinirhodobacter huangdaonensis]|jgi:DNA-binding GntR family transcriptional regulator|uniref:GntR family transcriptional regulator n=1 Tax=Paenirhodobacter huangdaonensis TaxID=2501515 RepID=A0A443LZL8_9RHOB|nr:GntR family transcriptional regulator [Sinirhodobacter huangdaonensis]RWR54695.1 GntR family transcriptional regulator [Sinirhodobacter huangdaonensis]
MTAKPAALLHSSQTDGKATKPLSLTEKVYQSLRHEILRCKLKPGSELSEAELAARFEVSKTPVREALAALRLDGLIRTFPRRGYQVAPITLGDINELFDLRTIIEAGTAELAAKRITDAEIEELSRLAKASYDPGTERTLDYFIDANRHFHLAIARASGNGRLVKLLERQINELERFFYLGATLRDVNTETNKQHQEIVDILASRDPEASRAILTSHNNATRHGLLMALAMNASDISL